jgi:hypothetical protein
LFLEFCPNLLQLQTLQLSLLHQAAQADHLGQPFERRHRLESRHLRRPVG